MIPSGAMKPVTRPGMQVNSMAGATTTQGPQLDTMPQNGTQPATGIVSPVIAAARARNQAAAANAKPMTNGMRNPPLPSQPGSSYAGGGGGYQGQINGVDPVKVNVSPDILNGFDQYRDAAYEQSTRTLDPQWQQAQKDFEQQMVGRGFSPGTAAYQAAYDNFSRGKNDAYSQARSQALAQGLQANQQAFGQGLAQSQLANDLQKAQWSLEAANTGAQASMYNSALNRDMNMEQLQWDKDKFGQTFGAGQDQQDFQNLMQLFGAGQGVNQYNNSLLSADQQRMAPLMNLFPTQGGSGQIDTQTPYNNQYNAQMNQAQAQSQQQQQQAQQYAQMASMLAMMFA